MLKRQLDFSNFEFIFKVISLVCGISFEPVDELSPNLHRDIIVTSLRASWILVTVSSFSQ